MTESEWLVSTDPQAMLECYFEQCILQARDVSNRKLRLFACACVRLVWDGTVCPECGGTASHEKPYRHCDTCGCTGRVGGLTNDRSRRAVEVAELYADGLAAAAQLTEAASLPQDRPAKAMPRDIAWALLHPEDAAVYSDLGVPAAIQANLLRCVVGNPFRNLGDWSPSREWWEKEGRAAGVERLPPKWLRPILAWNGGTVPRMAQAVYDDRSWELMPILGDALESAGCENADILAHCRGPGVAEDPEPWEYRRRADDSVAALTREMEARLPGPCPHVRGCWVVDLILGKE